MTEGRELELKYAVADVAAVRRLVDQDTLADLDCGPWRETDVVDQYLDTHEGALAKAGYGARLRRIGRKTLVTIKSTRAHGRPSSRRGLHDRLELEARATRTLSPARWPESPARALIEASAGGQALHTLFVLEQRREERDLLRDGVPVAKLSLDSGVVRRFGRQMGELFALEVEAVEANAVGRRALESVADVLDGSPDMRPEHRSKEELAQQMLSRAVSERSAARPPRSPGIGVDDSLAEAGRKVLRMHLLRMLVAETAARAGSDIEGVHKMRVATRRMRAAWRVFDGAYRPRLQKRYVAELRSVAGALGEVRDIDVQIERLAAHRAGLGADPAAALEALIEEWRGRRVTARTELLDLLGSAEYDQFITDYRSFVETKGAGAVEDAERVVDVAASRAWRAYERLRQHDQVVTFADVPALHALRIDAKRLRYTLEFLVEILPKTTERLIAQIVALQDHIGLLNDAKIAADETRAWLIESAATLTAAQRQAAAGYLRASEADVNRLRRGFRPLWRRGTGRPFRSRLASALSTI